MLRLNKILLIFSIFILLTNFLYGEKIFIKKSSLTIDLTQDIDLKLKNYILSSIPFKVSINITLKRYSGLFFIKDKVLKTYNREFNFNYDIIKKRFLIFEDNQTLSFSDYKKFLKKISVFQITDFFKNITYNDSYIMVFIDYSPSKGNLSISKIYILNKVNAFKIKKKIELEDLIGKYRH